MQQQATKHKTITIIVLLFIFFVLGIFSLSNNFIQVRGYCAEAYTSNIGGRKELYATEINLSNAINPTGGTDKDGVDFLIADDSTEYSFSQNNITFKGGYIIASIPITIDGDAGIYSAMRSPYMKAEVKFNGRVKALNLGAGDTHHYRAYVAYASNKFGSPDSFGDGLNSIENEIELISAREGIDDLNYAREIYLGGTYDFVASLGDSSGVCLRNDVNYSVEDMFSLKNPTEVPPKDKPHLILVIKTENADMKLEVSQLKLTVEVSFSSDYYLSISDDTQIEITGVNRETVRLMPMMSGVVNVGGTLFNNIPMNKVYIKSGDFIEIKYGIDIGSSKYPINTFHNDFKIFSKIFNSPHTTSDVLWRRFVKHADLSNEQNGALIQESIGVDDSGIYGIIKFKVASAGILGASYEAPVQNKLHIIPRLFQARKDGKISYFNYNNTVDFETFISDSSNTVWSLNIDNSNPNKPVIDASSEFGITIENKGWYTKNNSVPINLTASSYNPEALLSEDYGLGGEGLKLDSLERLYAVALPSNISSISVNAIDFGSSSPNYLGYQVTLLGALKSKDDDINKLQKEFVGGEINTLVLMTVDRAGNVSSPQVYSLSQGNAVRVDAEAKQIKLSMFVANEMYQASQYPNFGIGYFYINNPSLYSGDILKDQLPTSGSGVQSGYAASFKRDSEVVIRFSMNEEQASQYTLVRYNNANNSPGITTDKAVGREVITAGAKKIIHYDMIYKILDNDWNTHNGLEINLHFGELINIRHNQTKYTFKLGYSDVGIAQDINNDFDAFSKINGLQISPKPEMETEYFDTIKYSIKVYKEGASGIPEEFQGLPGRYAVVTLDTDVSHPIEIMTTSLIPMSKKGYTLMLPYDGDTLKLTTLENATKSPDSTVQFDLYNITSVDIDKPKVEPFIDAGQYGYRVSVKVGENSRYYGSNIGSYKIEKAFAQLSQLQQMGVLYFGDSVGVFGDMFKYPLEDDPNNEIDGKLKLQSKNSSGQFISHDDAININGTFYHASYIRGLYGIYTVLSPNYTGEYGDDFSLPSSSENYQIRIEYQPIDLSSLDKETIQNNFSFFQYYYDEVEEEGQIEYVIRPGTLHSGNYNKIEVSISVRVLPKQATVFVAGGAQSDIIERTYNGESQEIFFAAEDDNGPLIILNDDITNPVERKKGVVFKVLYRAIGGAWSNTVPVNAGTYEVEVSIDSTKCNYTSSPLSVIMNINKKQLNVEVDEEATENDYTNVTKKDEIFEFDSLIGITGIYEIDYMYMYLNRPLLNSIHPDIEVVEGSDDHIEYIENYLFSIYSEKESEWIYVDFVNSIYNFLDVGEYVFKVSIDSLNYIGTEHIKVRVTPPVGAVITEPSISLLENYETYALDGYHLGKTGHLEYGQILNESLHILDITSARPLIFRPAVGADILVDGRFYFETEEEYYDRQVIEEREYSPVNQGKLILPVIYEGDNPRSHKVRLIWEAGVYENDIFVKNNNYEIYHQEIDINVVRALLSFENVNLTSFEYGNEFNSSSIEGQIQSNGFSLTPSMYSLSLVNNTLEGSILNGGNHSIAYNFKFNKDHADYDKLKKCYYFYGEANIPLTVTPKEVTFNFNYKEGEEYKTLLFNLKEGDLSDGSPANSGEDTKGLIYYYSHENNESDKLTVNVGGDPIPNIRLNYMYFRARGENEEPNTELGEFIDQNYPDFIRIPKIGRNTKPGIYIVIISVSNLESNYVGSIQKPCYVIRPELHLNQSLPDLEFGYMLADLNHLLENITLNNGNQSNMLYFSGNLNFVENSQVGIIIEEGVEQIRIGEREYLVNFTPIGDNGIYQYFKPFEKSLIFNVTKRNVAFEYDTDSFTYTYNGEEQKPIINIKHPISNEYIPQERLNVILNIQYLSANGPVLSIIESGNYILKVKIREDISDEYTTVLQGQDTKNIVVNKAKINFSNSDIEQTYTGMPQSPIPVYNSDFTNIESVANEFRYNKTFVNYAGNVVEPTRVGKYSMSISVVHRNFEGSQNLTFYIVPSIVGFSDLTQVYANPNSSDTLVDVGVIFERVIIDGIDSPHQSVAYSVEYKYQAETVWTALKPNGDAGIYKVRVNFNQDGYIRAITTDLMGEELELIVEAQEIDFSNYNIETQLRTFYYNGGAISARFLLGEFSSVASYEYKKIDESTVYYIDGVPYDESDRSYKELQGYESSAINAGIYYTRISVAGSGNYTGTYYTFITIQKANLTVTVAPTLNIGVSSIAYGSEMSYVNSSINQNSAEIKWQKHGSSAPAELMQHGIGEWKVYQNISNYGVGDYRLDVTYELNADFSANFNNPLSKLNLKITKRDISQSLYFIEESLTQSYQAKELRVQAQVNRTLEEISGASPANISGDYPEIKLTIFYKKLGGEFSQAFPKDVGKYDVKVRIDDFNYAGEKISATQFTISKALPKIVVIPNLQDKNLGDVLSESDNSIISGGKAIIEGTQTQISGTFSIHENEYGRQFTAANKNFIVLRFVPSETQYYFDTTVQASIWIVGNTITSVDITVAHINGENAIYGESLNCFEITGTAQGGGIDKSGTFSWVNSNIVPNVGEEVDFQFIPTDTTFNIYYGKVTVPLNLGTMIYDANKSYLRVHKNQTILEAINNKQYHIQLADSKNYSIITQYDVTYIVNSASEEDLARVVSTSDIALPFVTCGLKIENTNYELMNITITSWAMVKIAANNITLSQSSKSYDGLPINIKQHLNINNTSYQISSEHIIISKILNSSNQEVEASATIAPDRYRFYISVDERNYANDGQLLGQGKYYGEAVVEFIINKRDITDDIVIVNNQISFIDTHLHVKFMVDDAIIPNEVLDVKYYRLNNDVLLGGSQPRALGTYYVKIKVLQTHPFYYSIDRRFDYIVEKANLNITFDKPEYQITFGQHYSILPSFYYMRGNIQVPVSLIENQGYVLSYNDKDNANQSVDRPQNAGNYRVTVTVVGIEGYKGSANVDLKINKAKTHIETTPFSPQKTIKYGDSLLHDVILEGGRAVETIGQTLIEGVFFLSDPIVGERPNAGEYNEVRVVFQPISPNFDISYSYMSIKVEQREIDFKFSNLSVFYTAEAMWPSFSTVLNEQIETIITAETLGGVAVEYPRNVGVYKITVRSNHRNYIGETSTQFTINAGKIYCAENPQTTNISYGDKLQASSISGGVFKNENNIMLGAILGTIQYKYPNIPMILGVGLYESEYIFIPNDANYEQYEGKTNVRVVKKLLSFVVENTTFIYGDLITAPTFSFFEGEDALVSNVAFEEELNTGIIRNVGTYGSYVATIEDDNYCGEVEYYINILKRTVSLDYYIVDNLDSKLVNEYQTQYGQTLNKLIKVNQSSLALFDMDKVDLISEGIEVEYGKPNSSSRFINAPTNVGEYLIYPKMDNLSNYTLKAMESIRFNIVKATVNISFENSSLTNNVYGSTILPPNIITSPVSANVKVKITFPGSGQAMPQSAGTHAVKAEIIDENYHPIQINSLFVIKRKALAITNIIAYDKAYDGLSDIRISGELEGIEGNDEVKLSMQAMTVDGRFNVGVHKIAVRKMSISGLAASNYYVNMPSVDNLEVKIKKEIIHDYNSESYARNLEGFDPNVSVEFLDIEDTANKTSALTKLIGQTAVVKRIVVMKNGIETTVDSPVKFYIKLPKEMLASKNLKVEFKGNLAGQSIQAEREDDYLTFHANSSGEILIYSNEFPYWVIVIAGAVLMLIVGIIAILIAYPLKKRKKVSSEVQRAYGFGVDEEEAQIRAEKRVERAEINKKRNWRK